MLSAVAARRAAKAALAPAPYGPENDPTATVNSDTPPPGTSQRPKPAPRQKRKRVPGNNSSRNQSPEKKRSAVAYREPETALSRRAQARETLLPGHAVAGNDEADESSSSSDEDIEGEVEDIGPSAQPVAYVVLSHWAVLLTQF